MNGSSIPPLSQAEILREAELIRAAISVNPWSPRADILSPSRELDAANEDRVVQALEDMELTDSD